MRVSVHACCLSWQLSAVCMTFSPVEHAADQLRMPCRACSQSQWGDGFTRSGGSSATSLNSTGDVSYPKVSGSQQGCLLQRCVVSTLGPQSCLAGAAIQPLSLATPRATEAGAGLQHSPSIAWQVACHIGAFRLPRSTGAAPLWCSVTGNISHMPGLSLLSSNWRPACHRHHTACSWPGAALLKVAINSSPTDACGSMPKAVSPRRPASPGSPRLKLGGHRGSKGVVSDNGLAVERSADSVLNALAKAEEAAIPKVSSCHLETIWGNAGSSQHGTS